MLLNNLLYPALFISLFINEELKAPIVAAPLPLIPKKFDAVLVNALVKSGIFFDNVLS